MSQASANNPILSEILRLKQEKNAVLLAHYYVSDDIQAIADYVGDSYYLSKIAAQTDAEIIVFCGVSFMGESAKILNPDKIVLMPDSEADCPMAHMASPQKIAALRKEYQDLAVVCYINSTAELKTLADVCVTSANAYKIVRALPNQTIFFIPDEHLGRYIASLLPEKHFIFNDGYCHVHTAITQESVQNIKAAKPDAKVLVHPECCAEVVDMADYIGSTSGIISYATKSSAEEFIVCTETGVFYELQLKNPDKKFYAPQMAQVCPNMKRITLDKILDVLKTEKNQVEIDGNLREKALLPLDRMLQLAGK